MFSKLFNKGKKEVEQNATASRPKMVFSGRPSQKKKDTYIIHMQIFGDMTLFSLCADIPMPVVKINGKPTENAQKSIMSCTHFPNPGATEMAEMAKFPEWRLFSGALHGTIIEYRDKFTGQPALMLFPNGRMMSKMSGARTLDDTLSHLNHATRRDLAYQIKKREDILAAFAPIYERRVQAMKHLPQKEEERYEFLRELDKTQIEYTKQIMAQRQK